MKNRTFLLLLFISISVINTVGQNFCSTSNKLVCQIPFSVGALNPAGVTPASLAKAQELASSFNAAIAAQISQLPLASSSSGTAVIYKSGVPLTYDNLGPILTDRAATVGRHNLFLSFTASQFYFTDLDGLNLNNIPFSYSASSQNATSYIQSTLNAHFKVNQYVAIGTFGATDKLDISMILPIERVSVGSSSSNITQYIVDNTTDVLLGTFAGNPLNTRGIASGIGDMVFAAKYLLRTEERGTLSVGLNERVPTGDDRNYLGSGAWGTNPYAVFSYVSRISPHVRLGYQWNSETELNPNTQGSGNLALPGGLQYDVGADWAATKHLTLAGDLMGNQYQNVPRIIASTLTFDYKSSPTSTTTITKDLPTVVGANSTYWINDVSAGAKWNPWKELIFTGNVLFQLNNVGMRARPTPLVGISYKFSLP